MGVNFPTDRELHRSFQMWQRMAQHTCMTLVKQSQKSGAGFPGSVFGDNPKMKLLQEKGKEELDGMTPEERGELLTKMQAKISVFAQLPPEARAKHMEKLSEGEQLMFVKAQLLLVSIMKEQWEKQQQDMQAAGVD